MMCKIRKWNLSDAADLAAAVSNKKVQDNLRDGLPYPYTEQDGVDFISAMLSADENETFAFAISLDSKVVGSIGVFRQGNIHRRTGELGYYIAEEYWGRGIMPEAVKQIDPEVIAGILYFFRRTGILLFYTYRKFCIPGIGIILWVCVSVFGAENRHAEWENLWIGYI